jgi:hypothetical protein
MLTPCLLEYGNLKGPMLTYVVNWVTGLYNDVHNLIYILLRLFSCPSTHILINKSNIKSVIVLLYYMYPHVLV